MDSILTSIKKLLGLDADYTQFDADIIMHINSTFMVLNQLGVGPSTPYTISDSTATWDDFIDDGSSEAVKTYIYMKVKILFDPPSSSFVLESLKNQISEYEWRLNVQND